MASITPTAMTFSQVEAPVVLATGANGTLRTLDLTTKRGAWLHTFIGRRTTTALTRSGYIAVRPTGGASGTIHIPNTSLDTLSSTAVAIAPTLSAGSSIGDATVTLSSGASIVAGDVVCIHSDDTAASRVEFVKIASIAAAVPTFDRNLLVAHNSGDRFTTMADVQKTWLPGGDVYEIRCINNSGYSLVFMVQAQVDNGDTVT